MWRHQCIPNFYKEDVSLGSAVLTTYVLRLHYMPFEQLWSLLEPHFASMRTSNAAHQHLLERIARIEQRLGMDVPVQEY